MTDAPDQSTQWQERRTETVPVPRVPLAPTGTYWPEGCPDGRVPDTSGLWRADGDAVVGHTLGLAIPAGERTLLGG